MTTATNTTKLANAQQVNAGSADAQMDQGHPKHHAHRVMRQRGYTLLEFMIIGAVIALLAIFGLPRVASMLAEGKVEPTANEFTGAVMRIRANAAGAPATPYASMSTAVLANTLRERSTALEVSGTGTGATLVHKMGATGSTVTAQPFTIATTHDAFEVTFNGVNTGACPGLSSMLQNTVDIISLNGTTVKSSGATYSGQAAQNLCNSGDTNTFVFVFR